MDFTITQSAIVLLLCAFTTVIFVQVFKTILNSILIGKFDTKTLFSDGDFPSSHTSTLVSFNIVFWHTIYMYHINHPAVDMFSAVLIGIVLALWSCYVIRDAMGVRLRVQEHAYAIKLIAQTSKELTDTLDELNLADEDPNAKALEEGIDDLLGNIKLKAGHLPHEVVGGIVTGGLIGCLFISISDRSIQEITITSIAFIIYILLTILIFVRKRNKDSKNNKI